VTDIPLGGIEIGRDGVARCWWGGSDPLYVTYHDEEWGRPVIDDRRLFEKISLEAFMSGLSWLTILRKRESFRAAFDGFDMETVASYAEDKVEDLLTDTGIVRNRAKIEATINNARRCIELADETGSLAGYLWSYEPSTGDRPRTIDWPGLIGMGVAPEATAMSKDLKKRGWRFVGPTTLYSVMESVGLVNDHMTACEFRDVVEREREALIRPKIG
jgi:DNA-3-methyladenine glycosylase I